MLEEETLDAFVQAWNEPDDGLRRSLLERAWADEGKFVDGSGRVEGRAALHAHIGNLLGRWPTRRLRSRGWLEQMGGRSGFRWTLQGQPGSEVHGYALTEVDDAGRLTDVACFEDLGSAAPEPSGLLSRLRAWAASNPLSVGSLALLLLYLGLRFQAEHFYGSLGVDPEEVGFGSVELVIRRATDVLASFAKVGLIWSIGYLAGMVPGFYLYGVRKRINRSEKAYLLPLTFLLSLVGATLITVGLNGEWLWAMAGVALILILMLLPRLLYPEASAVRKEILGLLRDWGGTALVIGVLGYGSFVFFVTGWERAADDSQWVKKGGWISNSDYPWRAEPVKVTWAVNPKPFRLPACRDLAYLGEADGWVVLYDRRLDRPLRLRESDVDISLPDSCGS